MSAGACLPVTHWSSVVSRSNVVGTVVPVVRLTAPPPCEDAGETYTPSAAWRRRGQHSRGVRNVGLFSLSGTPTETSPLSAVGGMPFPVGEQLLRRQLPAGRQVLDEPHQQFIECLRIVPVHAVPGSRDAYDLGSGKKSDQTAEDRFVNRWRINT